MQLNSTTSPGWNDPPPTNTNGQQASNSNRLQRLRRPVDPSIHNNPQSTIASTKEHLAPNSNFHQSRSFPQLSSTNFSYGIGTHPASAFTPTASAHSLSNSTFPTHQSIVNQQELTLNHPGNQGALSVNLPPPLSDSTQQPNAILGMNLANNENSHSLHQEQKGIIYSSPNIHTIDPNQQQMLSQNSATTLINPEPANGQNPMIFSLPNTVPLTPMDSQYRPTTQPATNSNRVPIKAAGDVSLTGAQLVAFMTKANFLLPQGPMREGIQLRINHFGELIQAGQISDPCTKKLNFVVDAIDRQLYEEAWQFFEQMSITFPAECATGGWAHGLRLLIQELRKGQLPNRAHSAGTRHF